MKIIRKAREAACFGAGDFVRSEIFDVASSASATTQYRNIIDSIERANASGRANFKEWENRSYLAVRVGLTAAAAAAAPRAELPRRGLCSPKLLLLKHETKGPLRSILLPCNV
jgi:hypothetical protein